MITTLLYLLINLCVVALIFAVVYWILGLVFTALNVTQPIRSLVLAIVALIALLYFLLMLGGWGGVTPFYRVR